MTMIDLIAIVGRKETRSLPRLVLCRDTNPMTATTFLALSSVSTPLPTEKDLILS
jgi:hypothetical protein